MLHGFTINGFRNFSGDPQWVAPLDRVNIFIGANNSGKSNILRFIKRIVQPLLAPGPAQPKTTSEIDLPANGKQANYYEFLLPYRPEDDPEFRGKFANWQNDFDVELQKISCFGGRYVDVPVRYPRSQGNPEFPAEAFPPPDGLQQRAWHDMWSHFTGMQGGGFVNWYPETRTGLVQLLKQDLKCIYIPSFRQITSRLPEFHDEYAPAPDGRHLIDDVHELANPRWNEQDKKIRFRKLQNFLRGLLENPDVEVEVPNDRSTINVNTSGNPMPLEALGSGIHEVFMLAAQFVLERQQTILLEEPEAHLHPGLQRQLMRFIMEQTEGQFFITTHSAAVIDTAGANIFGIQVKDGVASVTRLSTSHERFAACRDLGYKASDLLQTNCIVWVEGPSDRIYLNSWISEIDNQLVEGVHYSIMFYGGKLLSHVSADDETIDDYVKLLPINRHPAILIDSDRASGNAHLRETKLRVIAEMEAIHGFNWVTSGREIENYYSQHDRRKAVLAVHPEVQECVGRSRYDRPLSLRRGNPPKEATADKIAVANYLIAHAKVDSAFSDFPERMDSLVKYIRAANA